MRSALKWLGFAALAAAVLVCALYLYLRQSLPVTEGVERVQGLAGPVEVLRDRYGIPHIYAHSLEEAYYALGFAHAQDRLWQMEMGRRIGAGRLSEVFGAAGLPADRFLRTLGVRRAAEANLRGLDSETRRMLDAYAAGVNAYLAQGRVLPIEFLLTGVHPEPWSPVDSIAWTKMMAWDLGGNWRTELLRMRLGRTLGNDRIAEFLPPYPGDAPPALPDLRGLYGAMEKPSPRLAGAEPWRVPTPSEGIGSNSWVVSGARSATGMPLLANDPHLGLTAPPVWYFAHIEAPGMQAIGATLPGVPAIILGRNERIAWGFTNTGPDVQDFYLEKLDASGNYVAPSGSRPFTVFPETIKVKGGEDQPLRVRVSRHGPVLSDAVPSILEVVPRGYALALQWTALAEDDRTMQAAVRIAGARDWASFLAIGRDFHAPQQNVSYADVDGNIGFVAAGRVPIRRRDNDLKGLAPAPGWDARYDWAGYIPFDELPRLFNPPRAAVVTANQKITPPGYPFPITFEWEPPYRASRIETLLDSRPKHSVESFARMQADVVSGAARELLAKLLSVPPKSAQAAEALKRLAAWDGAMSMDRAEPLIFVAWWRELGRAVYADELGEAFRDNWLYRPQFLSAVLGGDGPQARWCDDVRTPVQENCEELAAGALEKALADLRTRYGADPSTWRWGTAHPARHEHRPFSRVRWLAPFFEIRAPVPGDAFTLDVGRTDLADDADPYSARHAPSLRAIYDLADLERSLFIHSGGQSGNVLSPHYRDFTAAWAQVQYIPMVMHRARLEREGVQRLELVPTTDERRR
ncbi:MAG: penicillin acylase family protein [Betaproteobacteria bacterium]|nr:penicillin acylase family protein [Betaproteobacteria bacterium]